ncbi:MAG: C10 family peptidase [Treponema sp.]|nr:C10 family peptidase [Treponema sp.]
MKFNPFLLAFFVTCALLLSNGGFLNAQETGDTADSAAESGGVTIIPSDDELASLLSTTPNPGAVVGPLLQTKWGQGSPYRTMLPAGHRSFCNLVAAAQVMKFHNHPARGTGQSEAYTMTNGVAMPSVNFANITFDWDNMLNTYRSDGRDSNEQQRNAVASLIYHAGLGRKRDFITGSSGNSWPFVLTAYFRYDRSIQLHERLFFTDAEWAAIIRAQLDAGLPVMLNALTVNRVNHYFIIDGYDNTGRFHFNCGWSGSRDGWYSINALNVGANEWNYHQTVVVNIKPDAGGLPAGWEMGLTELSADKSSVSQNELFTIRTRIKNLASLDNFSGGQLGAALVDANGRILEVIGSRNRAALNARSTSSATDIICYVPANVRTGQYRVMIVIRPENGEWRVITKSAVGNRIPNSINLTVNPAERGAPGGGYGLALENFSPEKTSVSQNEIFTVNVRSRNRNDERFSGQIGAALVDNNGNIINVSGVRNIALNAGNQTTQALTCYIPETVRAGQYRLRIVIRPENETWRIASLSMPDIPNTVNFTVTAERGALTGGGYGLAIQDFTAEKNSIVRPEAFSVSVRVRNISADIFKGGQLGVALVDNSGRIIEVFRTVNWGEINFNGTRSNTINNCRVPDTVRAGQYRLMIVIRPTGTEQWRIATMAIGETSAGIDFTVR